ncbi:TPA: hypothetical protein HA244_04430 [Candidatus Micrarchaeota archaeon]|nr:hypothetical protein [Candidatus Micrarchaeota archaeon]
MQVKTDLRGLKRIGTGESHGGPGKADLTYSTVWMPVQTEGKAVVKVQTRQGYLDKQLKDWRTIQLSRVVAIALGIAALFFLSFNAFVSAALGLAAGWFWGSYAKTAFFFEEVNRKREILEGT